jgi:hypothetical protein
MGFLDKYHPYTETLTEDVDEYIDRTAFRQMRSYYQWRQALSFLHNALVDICFGFTGSYEEFRDLKPDIDGVPSGDTGMTRYLIAATVRSYLDKDNPIGPDWNGIIDNETGELIGDQYDNYTQVIDAEEFGYDLRNPLGTEGNIAAFTAEGGCVIATHAVANGSFSRAEKRRAVEWCTKHLHETWYGEAFRRGYRSWGNKLIESGKAESHGYQEFRNYVDFVTGNKRTLRNAWTFFRRSITFFIKGLFISEDK